MSNNGTLRPQFWVLRPETNSMVPLIAVDELPPTINIRGVPRSLEARDLTGMTCAGPADSRHRTYIVDLPNESAASRHTPPPATGLGLSDSIFAPSAYTRRPATNPNVFPQPPKAYGISEQMPSHITSPATGNHVPLTSVASPPLLHAPLRVDRNPGPKPLPPWQDPSSVPMKAAPGVKEYCSYWLRCGECDYAQQGCLYKHEMPLDRDVLERLGHRDIPRWYREKHGLGSFLAGGDGAGGDKTERMERSWRGAREADERERDGAGRASKRADRADRAVGRPGKNVDKRSTAWRDEWEKKKRDGRLAPKGSDKIVASPVSSPTPTKTSPVKGRGPASRSADGIALSSGHYRSALARKTDEACLAALEADMSAKSREMEELKRLTGHEILQPKRRSQAKLVTPETSSSDERADFEDAGKEDDSEWVEGDADSQAVAISHGLKAMRLSEAGKQTVDE